MSLAAQSKEKMAAQFAAAKAAVKFKAASTAASHQITQRNTTQHNATQRRAGSARILLCNDSEKRNNIMRANISTVVT